MRERLGISVPIIQAPMAGGMTMPELVAAVCNAGGLGSIAGAALTPEALRKQIHQVRSLTSKPFAVNLFVLPDVTIDANSLQRAYERLAPMRREVGIADDGPPCRFAQPWREQFAVVLAERVPAFSFTFNRLARECIVALHSAGIYVLGTATSAEEARLLESDGVDAIVAQGFEAGGHRGAFLDTAADRAVELATLIPQIVAAVHAPVVAAGGIMDVRGVRAALKLGASAVQLGTAFLDCPEAGTHPLHRAALTAIGAETIVTRTASGKYARGLRNRMLTEFEPVANQIPPYPIQNALTSPVRAEAARRNRGDLMVMLAGTGHCMAQNVPASELLRTLAQGIEH